MSKKYCNKCGVELTDENWLPSYRNRYYQCKFCAREYKRQSRLNNPNYREIHRLESIKYRQRHPERSREINRRSQRKRGHRPMSEVKESPGYLGVCVAERVLSHVFKDVEVMPMHNPGFDFICNRGKRIDVKSACTRHRTETCLGWEFIIRKNKIADYFLCLAFDNREDLNPLYIWLLPAEKFNHLMSASISKGTIHKWDEYRLDINKVQACCDILRE